MNPIAQNPYRVLGMFANDSIKVMTANIARIRAYMKVNKKIEFESDFTDIFGPVERGPKDIENAISQLSNPEEALVWRLFWIHRTEQETQYIDDSSPCISSYINSAVLKLQALELKESVPLIKEIFDIHNDGHNIWEYPNFWASEEECRRTSEKYIEVLTTAFKGIADSTLGSSDGWFWWFNDKLGNDHILKLTVDRHYVRAAQARLMQISDNIEGIVSYLYGEEKEALNFAAPSTKILNFLIKEKRCSEKDEAEIKLLYNQFAECMLDFCKKTHDREKTFLAEPVLNMVKLISKVNIQYSDSWKTTEQLNEFNSALKKEAEHLAPAEVAKSALAIQNIIQRFCQKDDKVRWSLTLLRKCVTPLVEIKSALGGEHPCLEYLCTRISDNAVYSANMELNFAKQKFEDFSNREEALLYLKKVLSDCALLIANINQLKVSETFRTNKLKGFIKTCKEWAEKYEVPINGISADISLATDEDLLAECGDDYNRLKEYVSKYPDSRLIKKAYEKIWAIEDREFPKDGSARELLEYKKRFPNSHNEAKILERLNGLLLGMTNGTVFEYREMLRYWPNHPKKAIIEGRIDLVTFKLCRCRADWEAYLNDSPNGIYREDAKKCIARIVFEQCKTIADYNKFIRTYPTSELFNQALAKIEELVYRSVLVNEKFDDYLKEYPNGKYTKEIRDRKERKVYEKVLSSGNYSEYYQKYPHGQYTSEVKSAQEKALFASCKTPKDFKRYLELYPNGIYKKTALKVIKRHRNRMLLNTLLMLPVIICIVVLIGYAISTSINTGSKQQTESSETVESVDNPVSSGEELYSAPTGYTSEPEEEQTSEVSEYRYNSLSTGSRPYKSYFGRSQSGGHKMQITTDSGSDYIVIVKRHSNGRYVDHIYIKGGHTASMNLPDGTFDVFFYSGSGWNPYKMNGDCQGGFVENASLQKDGPVTLKRRYEGDYYYDQTLSYTLYPVYNGNLSLEGATEEEVF